MTYVCPFCARGDEMRRRIFYESEGWFAFLASPPNLPGHTIVAAASDGTCPRDLTAATLRGVDGAVGQVAAILRAGYAPQHVLFASLRVQDPHFHLHMFPVTAAQENAWRAAKGAGYESGRFFEFLGDIDRTARHRPYDATGLLAEAERLRQL